ncbi:cell division protein FtsL [Oceanospirillaceae bacterium]|jgi:cell division protein FtsL|uniref:cell division protein FtsL n=1 Tax=Candidatus Njordibacter sp. Uisw_002 TaxID=3230971 RepID=UPI002373E3BE|nr:cell division protein FtsL [Oceanospirillaceae bacterium]|tara:strand:+ start:3793 stop:4122 length:330 start_codon:yes stop_codon:yes gene_type:complete
MKDMSQNLNMWLKRASLQAERYAMVLGFLLLLLLVISAQMVIYSSFEARVHINHLHQLEKARNAMQVEWGQLLLEQSAWASHSRVESMVTEQLNMSVPKAKDTILVRQL